MAPSISLALPVYNGERFVAECIQAILNQDFEDFELVITDNLSTDGTKEICQRFAASDKRLRYVRNERNLGAAPNFNLGFALSSGCYFKWCAHDDLLSADFLGKCVRALEEQPHAVLAYGTTKCIDQSGRGIPLIGSMMPDIESLSPARRFHRILADWCSCYEIFGVIRRAALERSTLHRMYYGSDRALLAELALMGTFIHVSGVVFYNRDHKDRSLMIADKQQKKAWHSAADATRPALEHWPLLGHLFEIGMRHRRTVPPYKTLGLLIMWALRPMQLSRYALEMISLVSPSTHSMLRKTGWQVLHAMRRSVRLIGGQGT
jgi:glycosyltransferase involved in cell wall biosynthesis